MSNPHTSMMLPEGTLLNHRYRIGRHLASGGFGNTYEATDQNLGCRVAVKEFFVDSISVRGADGCTVTVTSPGVRQNFNAFRDKFKAEAQRISQLRHNHIVRVSDLFDANGTVYYVMEYISGQSLRHHIANGQPLPPQQAVAICQQVLSALEVIHHAGLYHLDVKPANIMLTSTGEAVLIDFGASKQIDAAGGATQHSLMAFSKGYAPTEQMDAMFNRVGPWTDFYALGATLYAMLTGHTPPFPSDITDEGDDAFLFLPDNPDYLRRAVLKMMTPATKKRPQTAQEVRQLLTAASLAQSPVQSPTLEVELADDAVTHIQSSAHPSPDSAPGPRPRYSVFTVNGVSYRMVNVEGGTFMMGATPEQGSSAWEEEKPAHQVSLDSFFIGETVVTQSLWQAVMGNNPSNFKGDDLPVESVSWNDCQEFIRKLNDMTQKFRPTGLAFRLPTEAEWEFAARGGNKSRHTKYAGGNNIDKVAWFRSNSSTSTSILGKLFRDNCSTHPVAQKAPNELGLYDMSGNVWEWCQDYYDRNYYSKSPKNNPRNDTKASYRVERGGGWYSDAAYCRVSYRFGIRPVIRSSNLGLRLAL